MPINSHEESGGDLWKRNLQISACSVIIRKLVEEMEEDNDDFLHDSDGTSTSYTEYEIPQERAKELAERGIRCVIVEK